MRAACRGIPGPGDASEAHPRRRPREPTGRVLTALPPLPFGTSGDVETREGGAHRAAGAQTLRGPRSLAVLPVPSSPRPTWGWVAAVGARGPGAREGEGRGRGDSEAGAPGVQCTPQPAHRFPHTPRPRRQLLPISRIPVTAPQLTVSKAEKGHLRHFQSQPKRFNGVTVPRHTFYSARSFLSTTAKSENVGL